MPVFLPKFLGALDRICGEGSGVLYEPQGEGWYRFVARDDARLAIVQGHSLETPAAHEAGAALARANAEDGPGVSVIPPDLWGSAFRMAKAKDAIGLAFSPDGRIVMAIDGVLARHQPMPSEHALGYLADLKLLPAPVASIKLDAGALVSLLQVAKALCDGDVTMLCYGPGRAIGLMAQGKDSLTFDAILQSR
jgi:hypothetical protein